MLVSSDVMGALLSKLELMRPENANKRSKITEAFLG